MAATQEVAVLLWTLISLGVFLSVTGKDPYLDFTCVASQALVPTRDDSGIVTITAYTPLKNANVSVDGGTRSSLSLTRVGGFNCSLETDDFAAKTTVIVSTEDANLYPSRLTVTTDNEDFRLRMTAREDCNSTQDYKWFEVGNDAKTYLKTPDLILNTDRFRNRSSIVFRNFCRGLKQYPGYVQVLFRECPFGKWSPEDDCELDCTICLNGGMCHPRTGACICPPGFSGSECQNVHGRNVFGQLAQYNCSGSADPHDSGCQGQLFCLPEPFGCTCAAGYMGIDCMEECEEGMYGANCEQVCHCQDNATCLADTGVCNGSQCLEGWYGPNCQETGLRLTLEYDKVNFNQTTNVTCVVSYASPLNESDFVMILPDGTAKEADYFVEYESRATTEYVFVIVADSLIAVYRCTSVGLDANATVSVATFEPPQLSTPPTVSEPTNSAITVTWEAWDAQHSDRGDGPLVNYTITYAELNTNGTAGDVITAAKTPGDTLSHVVRGLKEGTSYEFRVSAVRPGVGGVGPPSPPTIGNTSCAVPRKPTNLSILPFNSSALHVSWLRPANTNCPAVTYLIRYWLKKQGQCNPIKRNYVIHELETSNQSLTIGGLLPFTLYKFEVRSETTAGLSADTVTGRTATQPSVPGPPVLQSSAPTSTTLDFTWTAPDCKDRNGIILMYHYQLLHRRGNLSSEGNSTTSPSDETMAVGFENLAPCTEYQFRVRGSTSAGYGSFSELQNVSTAEGVPDRIVSLNISTLNSTQLRVSWSPPAQVPCQILGYTVLYTLTQQGRCGPPGTTENETISVPDVLTVNIPGLAPDSEYRVDVRARTLAGEGEGLNRTGKTFEGVPGPPTAVTVNETSSYSLSFTWTPPDCTERNGLITGYLAMLWNADAGVVQNTTVSETHVQFDKLLSCTAYTVQVGAVTSAGLGSITVALSATTGTELPDTVTDIQMVNHSRSLMITWQPPTGPPCNITGYKLTYKLTKHLACDDEDEGIDYESIDKVSVTTMDPIYSAQSLSPYSTYLVSVAALTSAGMGNWTSKYADTLQDKPAPPVSLSQILATSSALGLSWQSPNCTDSNGVIKGFYYQLTNLDTSSVISGFTGLNETDVTIEGLAACTRYNFRVYAQTVAGYSRFIRQLEISTSSQVPNAVTSFEAVPTATSLQLTWTEPVNVTCSISYLVSYKLLRRLQCPENETNTPAVNESRMYRGYTISELLPASRYFVSVRAGTVGGFGEEKSLESETLEAAPGKPTNVTLHEATSRSLIFTWEPPPCNERNGAILNFKYRLVETVAMSRINETVVLANITTATFDGLIPCTEYQFKVKAKTSAGFGVGFTEAPSVVTEGEVPKAVSDFYVSSESHSIRVIWQAPTTEHCGITDYLITYKLMRIQQCPGDIVDNVEFNVTRNSSSREHEINRLSPASVYSVTVAALNRYGGGEPVGREIATLESGPGAVSNVSIVSVGLYSANFSWLPPSCQDYHGNITGYAWTVELDTSSGKSSQLSGNTSDTSVRATTLNPCSTYTFNVSAVTSGGFGPESSSSPFTTRATVPGKVDTPEIASQNSTFAQITWPSPMTYDNPCPIQQYTVMYLLVKLRDCKLGSLDERFTVNTSDVRLNLVDLRPHSNYKVSVTASTVAGHGETSEERKIVTNPSVPGLVTGVRVTSSTMNSLRFAWNSLDCKERHDKINGYQYEFRYVGDSRDDDNDFDTEEETSELFAVFNDLSSCTEYKFRVRAVGQAFNGDWSNWVKGVTSTVLPEQVQNLTLRHGDDPATRIQVSWQPSALDDCVVSNYRVGYMLAESLEECSLNSSHYNWTYRNVDSLSVVLSGLQPYSRYTVTVSGITAAGRGDQATAVLQTSEDVPTGPPENISTSSIGSKKIRFIWEPPMCSQQNGVITSYNYTLTDLRTNATQISDSVITMDVIIGSLVPYVHYRFSVQANTAIGPGPVGHLVVRTAEGVPPPPRNFQVVTTGKYSLTLEWNPPEPPSGVLSAYQIKYWASSLDESSAAPLVDMTNHVHRYIISDLKPYTDYNIKIRSETGAGFGEWTATITHKTAEAAPEMPTNVNVRERTEAAITIDWEEPLNPNGILTGYKIEYRIVHRPFERSSSDTPSSESYSERFIGKDVSEHQIDNLIAATGYEIRLAAKTIEFGDYATLRAVYTMIPAISKPSMTEPPSLGKDNTVTLQLKPVTSPYISVYQVTVAKITAVAKRDVKNPGSYKQSPDNYIAAEFNKTDLPQAFKVGDNKTYGGYHNAALRPDTQYAIQFCGVGKTQQDTQSSCSDKSSVTTNPTNTGPGMAAILAAVIAVMGLVAVVLVVMVAIRKRRQSTRSTQGNNGIVLSDMEKADSCTNGLQNQAMVEEMVRSELRRSGGVKGESTTPVSHQPKDTTPPKKAWKFHKAVNLQDLPVYVKRKKANANKSFIRDYASYSNDQLYSCDVAQKNINKNKNRYANIIPYDYSRVVLDPINDDPETDYINASYIDGYKQKNAYIATQGPNKSSTPDFWRMVWQQESAIIIMLTNTVENAKKKCIQYWPDAQLDYNGIVVRKMSERVEQDFTERVFVIANISIEEDIPREVKQFHYTSWPDMGLPDSPAPLMTFIHEVKQVEENDTGPMVVHCSAGVGRTGTFITVDAMLNMVAEERQINVIDFVYEMRKKRPKMVQTQEQYMFIFEVLLETLLCGDTVMNVPTFPAQYAALGECNPLTGNSYVEEHFRVLDTMSVAPSDENCFGGRNEMNQEKNRFHDCIPLDKSRPYLMSPGDEGGTNYINASFIDAYKRKDGFIATQSPLPNTVVDFWRMVYDYNTRVIVMLNQIDGSDETCAPYWIDDPEDTALYGIFEVQLRDCKDFKHTIARTFKLKNTNKETEKPRTIHHFEFLEWSPEEEIPPSIVPFLSFMDLVAQSHRQTGGDGRVAVHCFDGVSRSGMFCAAMASLEKLKEEKLVDVFHAVRNLRRNRYTMVESQDQYLFCYDVLSTYLEENQTYANFR